MSFQPRDYVRHSLDEADMPAQDQPDPEASMSDTELLARITFRPEQCGGRPCIRGMRIRVSDVLSLLAAGAPEAEILYDYPYLEGDDIAACLLYAARRVDPPRFAA
jgi:uncharacterized protein (DUF433 family)